MKKFLPFFLFALTIAFVTQAQIEIEPNQVVETFELNDELDLEIIAHSLMVNKQSSSAEYRWERTIEHLTEGWEISFCDKERCWLPFVETGQVSLNGNESGTCDVHLNTRMKGEPGDSAIVRMTVFEVGNPDNRVEGLYKFYASVTSPNDDVFSEEANVTLYPNPANEQFFVNSSIEFGEIVLFNLVGKPVKTYTSNSNSYSLDGLPSGLYLARIYTEKGEILKTVRMHKR